MAKKKTKVMLSSFSIILILIFGLGILSHVLPDAQFVGELLMEVELLVLNYHKF